MASQQPTDCCLVAVKHEGEATGETKTIDGIDVYFAYPKDKSTSKAILFLTDVFGIPLINNRLIADQFAANGYFVAMPDLFRKDPIPLPRPEGFDMAKWRPKHTIETTDPIVSKLIEQLRGQYGVTKLGSVGYCWGAKWVVRFMKPGQIDAGFVAHPSNVEEEEFKQITRPLSIAAAQTDSKFPQDVRMRTENILIEVGVPWQINLYSGCEHGFAVKGDLSQPRVKFAKEQAFLQAVHWFNEHLK